MKTELLYELFLGSTGVNTDTRTIKEGQIFFALWGTSHNGNEYASEALAKRASWAVIDDPQFETEKTILVDDSLLELQALASHYRKKLNIPVLAITGTNGKTTTKELLANILVKKLRVHSTKGNLNNHIGVPLTILSAPEDTQIMIIEIGANHPGEIAALCNIAKPDYGIITNIGSAHLEGFGSFEGVVRAKTELYEYLSKVNGIALYNDRNPLLAEKIFKMVNRAVPFSDPTGIDLLIEQVPSAMNLQLKATYHHQTWNISTNLFGSYNLENVKAAIATALFLNVDMKDVVDAVQSYEPANNRSQVKVTKKNTLICDSYNANPVSMQLALESFSEVKGDRKIAILGDMLELGQHSEEEHLKLIGTLHSRKVREAYLVGPVFQKVNSQSGYRTFASVPEFVEFLKNNPVEGGTILIKGSRGIGLEKVYDLL